MVTFISDSARALLGFTPEVFPVSGRQALRAKEAGDAAALAAERLRARWRRFIADTLDEKERVRLKLLNPLGVGLRPAGAAPGARRRSASRCSRTTSRPSRRSTPS